MSYWQDTESTMMSGSSISPCPTQEQEGFSEQLLQAAREQPWAQGPSYPPSIPPSPILWALGLWGALPKGR